MKFLVFSHHHHLAPFAWRLIREGADVDFAVWAPRYQRAWEGRLTKVVEGTKPSRENMAPWIEAAAAGELTVLTDSQQGLALFEEAKHLYGPAPVSQQFSRLPTLLLGGWFNGDAELYAPHWLVPDWGMWPGGLGAAGLGGCTLIRTPSVPPLNPEYAAILRANNFKGLVAIGMEYIEASNELTQVGFVAGWNFLFTHLFVSGLQNFAETLLGELPVMETKTFVVGLPVTQPPYPLKANPMPPPVQLNGVGNELARSCFFHDIAMKGGELWTAGLDGLVAVVRGAGASFTAAQGNALAVGSALPLPQKQMRVDVGSRVPSILVGLEKLGYL